MPVHNAEIGRMFQELADLLEIEGANQFRVRAYRNAARVIEALAESVSEMLRRGKDLSLLPGIGTDLAAKIEEIVRTRKLSVLEDTRRRVGEGVRSLLHIGGLGPKRVAALRRELGTSNLEDLEEAAREGRIHEVKGFAETTERRILEDLARRRHGAERRLDLSSAEQIVRPLVEHLSRSRGVVRLEVAGSFRRRKETVGDIDIVAACRSRSNLIGRFCAYEDVERVSARGGTKCSALLTDGTQVDLRVVPECSFGAALLYFTGSKAHNVEIRTLAMRKKLKVNEYGVYTGRKRIAGLSEEEVYASLGLPYIPPELREGRGEIEAALAGALPRLIELGDIQGDLHAHTTETDGRDSMESMVRAAKKAGRRYIAITDHSKRVAMAHGLTAARLRAQMREVERLCSRVGGIVILSGIEVDILEDGRLDLPDSALAEVDVCVASVHSYFGMSAEDQTRRIIRAVENPNVDVLGHPTGRIINGREPNDLDMRAILEAAKRSGCAMELNAQPHRLDLSDTLCAEAKEMGVMISIATDSHCAEDLRYMSLGVDQARRGWLEPKDVLNALPADELLKRLRRRRPARSRRL